MLAASSDLFSLNKCTWRKFSRRFLTVKMLS